MGLVEFIIMCIIVVAIAWIGTWAISQIPNCPPIVPKLIWIVAIMIILVTLIKATGILGHDPQIPRL
jgi:hypothetical protein